MKEIKPHETDYANKKNLEKRNTFLKHKFRATWSRNKTLNP